MFMVTVSFNLKDVTWHGVLVIYLIVLQELCVQNWICLRLLKHAQHHEKKMKARPRSAAGARLWPDTHMITRFPVTTDNESIGTALMQQVKPNTLRLVESCFPAVLRARWRWRSTLRKKTMSFEKILKWH